MSIDAMRWAKKVKTGKSSSKAILTWLADMCGADLCAYPSVAALAEATELDKKTVQAGLRHLIEIGLIADTGERKGRTKQIPVYKLLGVEESVVDSEYTQNREPLKAPNNGRLNDKTPENGCLKYDQRHPFFPSKTPKNGIGNLPRNHKDLNPTHSEVVEPVFPEYPDQPGIAFGNAQTFGKFGMYPSWKPSSDFRRMAELWGMPLKPGINLPAELNSFIAYWQAEGKVFHQVQWEQKFARHLGRVSTVIKPATRGDNNVGTRPESTASRAVQSIQSAHAEWRRRNGLDGNGNGLAIVAGDGGNILEPVDAEKWGRANSPLDSSDRFND
ncbi:DNA-binding protein [Salmonella enterica subsp. enterica serovar Senftenberg]|nr:DNA-binding protein [Salmonella enterica subsp. enterica serovar Uganda]EBB7557801.1 DNA-binding protein [Salmonella enterica subsp. enterica serovar Senftenberg]ECH3269885.1 DNA-binding protein [Salmonella enterica]ECV9767178.1 DNA-binding protein [Salmonella enterica subsp. enterica serovar Senftenberg]EFL6959400.1 DNA-binding protein [Salmonella enterica subsp. enterica serovar Senftenberg]